MTVKWNDPYTPFKDKIRALEDELYLARRTIVNFMPPTIADVLTDFRSCSSHADFIGWQRRVIDLIISKAEVDPKISHWEERGWCPLCKEGTRGPYDQGFKIPGGLERHLFGESNASQCVVTEAAFRNARNSLPEEFEAEEELARQQLEERRRLEQTFLIDPAFLPQLIDEGVFAHKGARSAEQLAWAEERLATLGFQKEMTANVIAYKLFHDGRLVLADPRAVGRIRFTMFNTAKPTKKGKRQTFDLQDGLTRNLPERFGSLLIDNSGQL